MTAVLDHLAVAAPVLTDGWELFGGVLGGSWAYGGDSPGYWWGQLEFAAGPKIELLTTAVVGAPDAVAPLEAVATALEAAGALLQERREYSRRRQAVINANAALQERELIKLASLASALADALRRRGVTDPAASLTAEAGIAVFKIAFERWVSDTGKADLPQLIRAALGDLRAVTAGV